MTFFKGVVVAARWKSIAAALTLAIATTIGLQVAVGGPAQAASGWSSFPEVCRGCTPNVTYVRLWQYLLWSEYGPATGKTCTDFVDGQFGPNTETWTKNWQRTYMPASEYGGVRQDDGRVGPKTWGKAYTRVVPLSPPVGNWTHKFLATYHAAPLEYHNDIWGYSPCSYPNI